MSEPNGLLAVGGDLSTTRLLNAYYHGIFPWFNLHDPILWWSPDPRAVFIPGTVNITRSLRKYLKHQRWQISINHAFAEVMLGCAAPRPGQDGTWITPQIRQAYQQLHQLGHAHSIEVWDAEQSLIGGLYGIAVGQVFCGESMFHRQSNASKAAFIALHQLTLGHGFKLIDAQVMNPYLLTMGAQTLPRQQFLAQLYQHRDLTIATDCWTPREVQLEL